MALIALRDLVPQLPADPRRPPPRPGPPLWFGFVNALVIYTGVLAAGLARAYSLRYRERQQHAVQLQARLARGASRCAAAAARPHFLFNTLNAVSSLVERDPRGVRRMIARLSELLRYSLEGTDDPEIPLRQELELLGRYLDIMQVLVVDDEPLGRLRVEDLLRGQPGVDLVGIAADGPSAVQAIRALQPDLVFLDVQVPGVNGISKRACKGRERNGLRSPAAFRWSTRRNRSYHRSAAIPSLRSGP